MFLDLEKNCLGMSFCVLDLEKKLSRHVFLCFGVEKNLVLARLSVFLDLEKKLSRHVFLCAGQLELVCRRRWLGTRAVVHGLEHVQNTERRAETIFFSKSKNTERRAETIFFQSPKHRKTCRNNFFFKVRNTERRAETIFFSKSETQKDVPKQFC